MRMTRKTQRPWTNEDVEKLRALHAEATPARKSWQFWETIALKMDRSTASIQGQARKMGLTAKRAPRSSK